MGLSRSEDFGRTELSGNEPWITTKLDAFINWGRSNSLWPMPFGTACCAIEFMATAASRFDLARFGMERMSFSPRQADVKVDSLQESIKLYLTRLTRTPLDEDTSRKAFDLILFTTNLEHVGDILDKTLLDQQAKGSLHLAYSFHQVVDLFFQSGHCRALPFRWFLFPDAKDYDLPLDSSVPWPCPARRR